MSITEDYIGNEPAVPGKPTSIWLDTTSATNYPQLEEELEADVVIVGGGLVGLLTAFLLVSAGKKVVVLEAHKIAGDVTGHTTAKITSQHGLIYSYLISNFGLETARLYGNAQETAIDMYETIIKDYRISCDFFRTESYLYTEDYDLRNKILKEVHSCERIDLPVDFVGDIGLPFETRGAEKFTNQAQFHPRDFCIGIAKVIKEKGGLIYENSRAISIEDGDVCDAITEKGHVVAKKMIIATNFPVYDTGGFFSRLYPYRSYVLAGSVKEEIPKGMYYGIEKHNQYFSIRTQKVGSQNIGIFGGIRHFAGRSGSYIGNYKKLEKKIKKRFELTEVGWHWSTQDNFPLDRLPYIGESPNTKNTYMATGFAGWGMTNSGVAAIVLTDLLLGKEGRYKKLFNPKRYHPKFSLTLFEKNLESFWHLYKDKFFTKNFKFIPDLLNNEGVVISYNKKNLAIYKDGEGKIVQLSDKCTHMGCGVDWNNAEKTWDCHCHGSRFDARGNVIHGPANKNLKEEKPE